MTIARAISPGRRMSLKPAVYLVGLIPAAMSLYLGFTDQLGADPV